MADAEPHDVGERFRRDDERQRTLYSRLLAQHGNTAEALNWKSRDTQRLRFQVLAEVGIAPDASVLDVGCGTGDLLGFLRARGFRGAYRGIDVTPEMIDAARTRFRNDAAFAVGTVLDLDERELGRLAADIVVASGIFYARQEEPLAYLQMTVRRLFAMCRSAVAFNSLSTWADRPAEGNEFRADPLGTLQFCRTLAPFVVLRHDYHPGDFTVYMRREAVAAPAGADVR